MLSGDCIMMLELLNRAQLTLLNRKLKYPLVIAEKDYFLVLVSKIIYNSKLSDKLIFKGGTALYHVYLPQLRFSEDLDFSTNAHKINLSELRQVFAPYDFLEIKKDYQSVATAKIEKLQYDGPLGLPNSLKVEIDFFQNVVLPPLTKDYHNVYGVKTKVWVMDIREIAAEKIRAMNDRIRYRDFYDFTMIISQLGLSIKEVLKLVRRKEVRQVISRHNILGNWELAKQEKLQEYSSIAYSEELEDRIIENTLGKLKFTDIRCSVK